MVGAWARRASAWERCGGRSGGGYTIVVQAGDGVLTSAQAFVINVTNVNEAPVLSSPGSRTATQNGTLSFTLSAVDADVPANAMTYSIQSGAAAGMVLDSASGAFTWTPATTGSYVVTFRVTDNDDPSLFDEKTVTITVNAVNPTQTQPNRNGNGSDLVAALSKGASPLTLPPASAELSPAAAASSLLHAPFVIGTPAADVLPRSGSSAQGVIGGQVFWDANHNGLAEPDEIWDARGSDGVFLILEQKRNGVFVPVGQTTADETGRFDFTGLPPGTYRVRAADQGNQAGKRFFIKMRGDQRGAGKEVIQEEVGFRDVVPSPAAEEAPDSFALSLFDAWLPEDADASEPDDPLVVWERRLDELFREATSDILGAEARPLAAERPAEDGTIVTTEEEPSADASLSQ